MKKVLFAAGFALAFAATPALAQDDDFLNVGGQIDYNCDVTFGGQNTATVNFVITGDQPLGVIRYICNDPQGFSLTVRSANGGQLKNGSHARSYTLDQAAGDNANLAFDNLVPTVAGVTSNHGGFQIASADSDGSSHQISLNLLVGGNTLPGGLTLSDTIEFEVNGL